MAIYIDMHIWVIEKKEEKKNEIYWTLSNEALHTYNVVNKSYDCLLRMVYKWASVTDRSFKSSISQ